MKPSRSGIDLVAGFEGFSPVVYLDAVGVETVGYGETDHATIAHYRTRKITEAEAKVLLGKRLGQFAAAVERLVTVRLSQPQFDALTSFTYNLGEGALASSTLLRLLNTGHTAKAANEFPKWDKAGGKELLGLKRRRHAERALFLKGSNRKTRLIARATFNG